MMTRSGRSSSASSTASRPSRARPTSSKPPSASSTASSESRNASSSSATRMRYTTGLAQALRQDGRRHPRNLHHERRAASTVLLYPDAPVDAPHELAADVQAEPR